MFEGILRNSKILVVDGDARSRTFLRAVLAVSKDGMMEFAEASTFDEALKILTTFNPDLIIADRTGNSSDGLELLRCVRKGFESVSRFTPYILVTEKTDTQHLSEARDAGATQRLEKPVSVTELHRVLAEVLRNTRPFVNCEAYFGPDRRQRDTHYSGDDRRLKQAVFVSPPLSWDPPSAASATPGLEEPAA